MSKDPAFRDQYHLIYGCFTIIKNALLCIGILVNKNLKVVVERNASAPDLDLGTFNPLPNKPNL